MEAPYFSQAQGHSSVAPREKVNSVHSQVGLTLCLLSLSLAQGRNCWTPNEKQEPTTSKKALQEPT